MGSQTALVIYLTSGDKLRVKDIVRISEKEGSFADVGVTDYEQFEHVIEVLVRNICCHLRTTTAKEHVRI